MHLQEMHYTIKGAIILLSDLMNTVQSKIKNPFDITNCQVTWI